MAEIHGVNGLVYVSGTEIAGANAWTLNIDTDILQPIAFGNSGWKSAIQGAKGFSGTINAYEQGDSKVLVDAATASASVAVLIYPTRDDLTSYYSGNAVFAANTDGNSTSVVNKNGSFTGDGALTVAGFA